MLLFAWFVFCIERLAHAEQRQYRDAFDSITFLTTVMPVFLICAIGALCWAGKSVFDLFRRRGFESTTALIIAACLWTGLIYSLRFMDVLIGRLAESPWLSRLLSL
jgi:hypothetical protein